jgi:hypothetical protein
MIQARDILSALRTTALWLLALSVFFGPAGLGGSSAFAFASKTCSASCPCDEALQDDHIDNEHSDAPGLCTDEDQADGHEDSSPCEHECPDNCPNCSCGLGVAMAVIPLTMPSTSLPSTAVRMLAPPDAPGSRARSGVFRPPRTLS